MTLSLLPGIIVFSRLDGEFLLRESVSFALALAGVLILFVRLNVRLDEFLVAVLLAAVLYSLVAVCFATTKGFSLTDIYVIRRLREYVTDWPNGIRSSSFSRFVSPSRDGRAAWSAMLRRL